MSVMEFKNILKFVGAKKPTPDERNDLFKEAAFMVLARATSADTNMQTVEVESVQAVLQRVTGEEISLSDIGTAAQSEIFERTPLKKYLSSVGRKLDAQGRMTILRSLAEVLHSDDRISAFETDYFDMVAEALHATPSEIAGLVSV